MFYTNDTAEYAYDGGGRRVRKIQGAMTTVYAYDAFGNLAAEYATTLDQNLTAGTFYRTLDHLGSTRIITDQSGAVSARQDFFPFGEEILGDMSNGNRNQVTDGQPTTTYNQPKGIFQKFTGKERDDESGMDYFLARYYSASLGRFNSVDPLLDSGRASDPQSWDRYAYARNNPLRFVDPNGLDFFDKKGNLIGTDGNQNGEHFIVTNKKERKIVKKADKKGGTTSASQLTSTVKIPGKAVRTEIDNAVTASSQPSAAAGDSSGGLH